MKSEEEEIIEIWGDRLNATDYYSGDELAKELRAELKRQNYL